MTKTLIRARNALFVVTIAKIVWQTSVMNVLRNITLEMKRSVRFVSRLVLPVGLNLRFVVLVFFVIFLFLLIFF